MLKPTPYSKPTPINASHLPTLFYLEPSPWCKSARAHEVMVLGAISGATSYWPPLPSYRVGNMIHSISCLFKVFSEGIVNTYSSHSIHRKEQYKPTKPRGAIMGTKGVGLDDKGIGTHDARRRFYNRTGCDHGGGHVGL